MAPALKHSDPNPLETLEGALTTPVMSTGSSLEGFRGGRLNTPGA